MSDDLFEPTKEAYATLMESTLQETESPSCVQADCTSRHQALRREPSSKDDGFVYRES